MRSEPRQQVIRRVTTTFEVPVKEEDIDDEEFEESASASTSVHSADVSPTMAIVHARKAIKAMSSHHKLRQRSKRSVQADDDDSYVEDEVDDEDEPHGHGSSSVEEDDELMMGAEVSLILSSPIRCK
jgi:hypothetical protein